MRRYSLLWSPLGAVFLTAVIWGALGLIFVMAGTYDAKPFWFQFGSGASLFAVYWMVHWARSL